MTTYVLYDEANRQMEVFTGPCRLAKWDTLPEGWGIEEFYYTVSRGCISLEEIKRRAAEY